MTEYISGLLVTVFIISIASFASYGTKSDGATKTAFAVLLFYVAVLPIAPLVESLDPSDIFDNIALDEENVNVEYAEVAREAFCEGIKSLVCEKYDINEDEIHVMAENFDFKSVTAEKIRITLTGRASLKDYKAIESYVESFGDWECDAEIEIG